MKDQGHFKVKIILRPFQNQIVSVLISIPKRTVGFRPNAFLLLYDIAVQQRKATL